MRHSPKPHGADNVDELPVHREVEILLADHVAFSDDLHDGQGCLVDQRLPEHLDLDPLPVPQLAHQRDHLMGEDLVVEPLSVRVVLHDRTAFRRRGRAGGPRRPIPPIPAQIRPPRGRPPITSSGVAQERHTVSAASLSSGKAGMISNTVQSAAARRRAGGKQKGLPRSSPGAAPWTSRRPSDFTLPRRPRSEAPPGPAMRCRWLRPLQGLSATGAREEAGHHQRFVGSDPAFSRHS